ncbi:MAG: divergent PAP2 family protein [Clostridia bacterium]|nr:divergent PAP2 family protein [Clostridia bacterium]
MSKLWNNQCLWIPIITWFVVQTIKVIVELAKNKKIDIRRWWGSGGMPSSHSAFVSSLATAIGLTEGFDSAVFAMSIALAAVVMYDASGVRRAAGKQAKILNQLIESEGKNINVQEKLIELLGHTPLEVYVGALIGITLASLLIRFWN